MWAYPSATAHPSTQSLEVYVSSISDNDCGCKVSVRAARSLDGLLHKPQFRP